MESENRFMKKKREELNMWKTITGIAALICVMKYSLAFGQNVSVTDYDVAVSSAKDTCPA